MIPFNSRPVALPFLMASGLALSACAEMSGTTPKPALLEPEPPKPVEIVQIPKPLPLPGQLKALHIPARKPEFKDPKLRVAQANRAARMEPERDDFINAVQIYPFSPGALYQLYAAPGQITDITLEEGESLVGTGPIAAGDTVRWIIGDTESGAGPSKRIHILVKPTRPDLTTNLIINTDRRTYHLELHATEKTYLASLSWTYPEDQLFALHAANEAIEAATPMASGVDLSALRFRYVIKGDRPAWRPVNAFDDGHHVYIEFPSGIAQGEMPPLFVTGPDGSAGELVNYRVRGHYMIVDRLFAAAQLKLGSGRRQSEVHIIRDDHGSAS